MALRIKPKNRKWWMLLGLCLIFLMVVLDNVTVHLLPSYIMRDLNISSLQYFGVMYSYDVSLVFALVVLGPLFGRWNQKSTLLVGLFLFIISSVAAGSAGGARTLILFRCLQGVGAALIIPALFGTIWNHIDGVNRATAINILASMILIPIALVPVMITLIVGNGLGQTVNEMLNITQYWRYCYFGLLPLGLLAYILINHFTPRTSILNKDTGPYPWINLGYASCILILLFAFISGQVYGWQNVRSVPLLFGLHWGTSNVSLFLSLICPAILLGIGILLWQYRQGKILGNHQNNKHQIYQVSYSVIIFAFYVIMASLLFLLPIALGRVGGLTLEGISLALLPTPVTALVTILLLSKLRQLGLKQFSLPAGAVLIAIGTYWSSYFALGVKIETVTILAIIIGVGTGMSLSIWAKALNGFPYPQKLLTTLLISSMMGLILGLVGGKSILQHVLSRDLSLRLSTIPNIPDPIKSRVETNLHNGNFILGSDDLRGGLVLDFQNILEQNLPAKAYVLSLPETERPKLKAEVIKRQNELGAQLNKLGNDIDQITKDAMSDAMRGTLRLTALLALVSALISVLVRPKTKLESTVLLSSEVPLVPSKPQVAQGKLDLSRKKKRKKR